MTFAVHGDRFVIERTRADRLLVERGIFASRAQAQAAIAAGRVLADGIEVRKASQALAADARIDAEPAHGFVSRGGVKLEAALDRFRFDPGGKICLDIGASTGGFTQVLLERRAKRVYAVDVGRGQLHASLRGQRQIVSLEKTDARKLDRKLIPEPVDLITVDVSFISLKHVLPAALVLAAPEARLVALIKPQFEAGRHRLKKGIVRDPAAQRAVCEDIIAYLATLGWTELGVIESPILGGDGNREFLLGAHRG
jgi:23S rRNA (cytidine1920-2'-O)/16S rRNA (cytidine1409-2'-O)-methyltransferase